MKPPFFVIDREGWVTVHESAEELEVYHEPWFVHEGLAEAVLDSEGRMLRLEVVRLRVADAEPTDSEDEEAVEVVRLTGGEERPTHERYLRDALRRALRGSARDVRELELPGLVRLALQEKKGVGVGDKVF